MEGDAGAGLVGVAHGLDVIEGFALAVFLLVYLAVAEDVHYHVFAECVHAAYAHAVETAGHFVAALVEFAACVQHGHDHFEGGAVLLFVHVYGDTAAVVLDGDAVVFVDADVDFGAEAGKSLVDGVVHHFIDQMVEATEVHVADIHGGTHPHGLKAFQYGNITRAVFVLVLCCITHF